MTFDPNIFLKQTLTIDALVHQSVIFSRMFDAYELAFSEGSKLKVIHDTCEMLPLESPGHRVIVDTIANSFAREQGLADIGRFITRCYPNIVISSGIGKN